METLEQQPYVEPPAAGTVTAEELRELGWEPRWPGSDTWPGCDWWRGRQVLGRQLWVHDELVATGTLRELVDVAEADRQAVLRDRVRQVQWAYDRVVLGRPGTADRRREAAVLLAALDNAREQVLQEFGL